MTFYFVCRLLNVKRNEAVKWEAQCPTEFRQSATGQSGVSQPKRGPEVTQSLSKLDSQ